MIKTKRSECYLIINDGNYCSYSDIDSQFFRMNKIESERYLNKWIEKDPDQISLPLTDDQKISYTCDKYEQYVYRLKLKHSEENGDNIDSDGDTDHNEDRLANKMSSHDLNTEIDYQLKQLRKCKQNGQSDGPWDEYSKHQKKKLWDYRFSSHDEHDSSNQIYYQATSDAVIFLEENDLEGFKLATKS